MNTCYLGIDPGISGGLAAIDTIDGETFVWTYEMPPTDRGIWDLLRSFDRDSITLCALEKVTGRPRQRGAMRFAEHNGALRALVVASGVPTELVAPGTWQRALGCLSGGDKSVLRARAEALFPGVKVTAWNQDALLLAEYARRLRV